MLLDVLLFFELIVNIHFTNSKVITFSRVGRYRLYTSGLNCLEIVIGTYLIFKKFDTDYIIKELICLE